jgi:hypothetical protein
MKIEFLRNKNEEEVRALISNFARSYRYDLHQFAKTNNEFGLGSCESAISLSVLLKKWTACRPSFVSTNLQQILKELETDFTTISGLDLRNLRYASVNEKGAIDHIWSKLTNQLCKPKKLTGVAPSKVMLIVTNGRLGPALDSQARAVLGLSSDNTVSGVQYRTLLEAISEDLFAFEEINSPIRVETLVPKNWQPVFVGRAYDMAVGPRD